MMASVVVGLGKTGASCLRYLSRRGVQVSATDTRTAPPGLGQIGGLAQTLDIRLGGFDLSLLDGATQLLMSPGVSLHEPIARRARDLGLSPAPSSGLNRLVAAAVATVAARNPPAAGGSHRTSAVGGGEGEFVDTCPGLSK